jgi:hypothetical protein
MRRLLAILMAIGLMSASLGCVHGVCDCNDLIKCSCQYPPPPFLSNGGPQCCAAATNDAPAPKPEAIPTAPKPDK